MIEETAPQPSTNPFEIPIPVPAPRMETADLADTITVTPGSVVGFDLETHSADSLFTHPVGEYVKLVGLGDAGNVAVTTDTAVLGSLTDAERIVTVNGNLFDMVAIDRHHGIPVEETIPKSHDLRMVAFQADPPTSDETDFQSPRYKSYSLEALASRYLADEEKSGAGDALAKEYAPVCTKDKATGGYTVRYVNGVNEGQSWASDESVKPSELKPLGWGNIPNDDPRFVAYCRSDVNVTLSLADKLPMTDYDRREARVSAVTARATLEGFRVDVPALTAHVAKLDAQSAAGRRVLAETYGFPADGKAPQRTKLGKAAFHRALTDFGFPTDHWPKNQDGTLSLSKDNMGKAAAWAEEANHPALKIIQAVQELNGVRNNASNLLNHLVGDRVHPKYEPFQATGRWSIKDPGLTVLAKPKRGKFSERSFLLPEEGHVLVSIDLDQADPRCVAAHSQDPNLIAIVNNPETDFHTEVSLMAFGSAEPQYRTPTKTLDIGWMYGRGVRGMVENTKGMTWDIGNTVVNAMKSRFGGVMAWQDRVRAQGEAGFPLNNGFGRRILADPRKAYTQSPAMVGQSTTRDILAEGLLTMAEEYPFLLSYLRVIVHDEVILSLPEDRAQELATLAQSCIDRWWAPEGAKTKVHFTAGDQDFLFGKTWAECYEDGRV